MKEVASQPNSEAIHAAAAAWEVRLQSQQCTEIDRAAFSSWCQGDPRHLAASQRLQQILGLLRDSKEHPKLRGLRERALGAKGIVGRRRAAMLAMAASVAVLGITVVWLDAVPGLRTSQVVPAEPMQARESNTRISTGERERKAVALADGSSVVLNAGTLLETEWYSNERRMRLLSGQALFRVAKDAARPFIVVANDRAVTAIGTAFEVKVEGAKVQVTLMEGRVAVRGLGRSAAQPVLELLPAQQLTAAAGAAPSIQSVDINVATGWATGQVFFTDEPLSLAVAKMNSYSAQRIVVADQALEQYRINGMFLAGNQDSFVEALSAYYPIDVRRDNGEIVLLQRDSAPKQ